MMQKRFLLLIIALLLLTVGVTHAAPVSDLTALAQYFPQETVAFAAMRTDDAFIDELDGLLAKITSKLPPGAMTSSMTLQMLLDLGAQQLIGKDFASGIRSWLGDTAAIGVPALRNTERPEAGAVFVASITNRTEAEAVWLSFMQQVGSDFVQTTGKTHTLISDDGVSTLNGGLLIGDDVMMLSVEGVGMELADLYQNAGQNSLTDLPKFNETLSLLPLGDYSMAAYVDVEAITGFYVEAVGANPDEVAGLDRIISAFGMGVAMPDGDSLVMDGAFNVGEWELMMQFGDIYGLTIPQIGAIDPTFARFIPADSAFVLHSTNLKDIVDFELGRLSLIINTNMTDSSTLSPQELLAQNREELFTVFKDFTGLDLDTDVLSWLGGDFAVFGRLDGEAMMSVIEMSMQWTLVGDAQIVFNEVPFGGGLVIEATDPAKAQAFAAALGNLLAQSPDFPTSQDQIAGVDVTVITQPMGDDAFPPLEWVIGTTDEVFFVASRPDAEIILSGEGGLDASVAYQDALANSSALLYASPESVESFALFAFGLFAPAQGAAFNLTAATLTPEEVEAREEARQHQIEQMQRDFAALRSLATLFQGATLSIAATPNGDALARLVIQLGE